MALPYPELPEHRPRGSGPASFEGRQPQCHTRCPADPPPQVQVAPPSATRSGEWTGRSASSVVAISPTAVRQADLTEGAGRDCNARVPVLKGRRAAQRFTDDVLRVLDAGRPSAAGAQPTHRKRTVDTHRRFRHRGLIGGPWPPAATALAPSQSWP